ncbi:uncharacterized protein METZ01_LOCUS431840, partial [marine metagenome]
NPVLVPEGIDEARLRGRLLQEYGIEVGGGLGKLKGKAFRVGLMGQGSQKDHVLLFLGALEEVLLSEGHQVDDSGVSAAGEIYSQG